MKSQDKVAKSTGRLVTKYWQVAILSLHQALSHELVCRDGTYSLNVNPLLPDSLFVLVTVLIFWKRKERERKPIKGKRTNNH